MPNTLMEFFEEEFRSAHGLSDFKVKRYRNSIARASQLLEHPAEYIDAVDPGFRSWFIEHLLRLGFTINRAEEFAACIRKVAQAMREHKRATPRCEPNLIEKTLEFIADRPGSIAAAFTDIIGDDDDVCVGDAGPLEKLQAGIRESEEAANTPPSASGE